MSMLTESLASLFDASRSEHMIDVMQGGLLACTCGESLPILRDDEGQPLYNPAIRHHHEQFAVAVETIITARETALREEIAADLKAMAGPWGGEAMWLTTGNKVATLVADIVRGDA